MITCFRISSSSAPFGMCCCCCGEGLENTYSLLITYSRSRSSASRVSPTTAWSHETPKNQHS